MNKGELDYAIRKALNRFDEWNDITGFVPRWCSVYFEVQGVIEDAVKIGAKIACEGLGADLSSLDE